MLNQAISILNSFTTSESTTTVNEIYQTYFKSSDNDNFQKSIKYLVQKQYLVQTSIIIRPKIEIKNKHDYKKVMFNRFCNLISHETIYKEEEKNEGDEEEDENYYYEDFLRDIKNKSKEDFFILSLIKNYIYDKLYINEISYYTGIKIKDILNTVKKYEYIFDLVVVPLYDIKK